MTAEQIIGLSLALLVMSFGLAGSVLPGIPSTPLILLAAVGHRLWFGAASVGNWSLAILGALLFEMIGGREWKEAARAGLGAVMGLFVGALGKLACSTAMMGLFAFSVIARSLNR